jgi:hypothetical protein
VTGGKVTGGKVVALSVTPGSSSATSSNSLARQAYLHKPDGYSDKCLDHVAQRQPDAGVAPCQQQRTVVPEEVRADVGTQPGHIGAAVVEAEPEPASELREPGFGADRRVQVTDPPAQVEFSAGPARQWRRDDVADPLVCRRWQQPGLRDRVGRRRHVGDPAQLHVAAGGQLQRSRAEPARHTGQRRQLGGRHHAAGQSDANQRAVGRLMHLQCTRATIGVAGSGHRFTVRQVAIRRKKTLIRSAEGALASTQ